MITETEIRALEDELQDAMVNDNIAALDKLLHDDLQFIAFNGMVVSKAMDLDSHRSDAMSISKMTRTDEHIKIIGDTATVTVSADLTGIEDSQRMTMRLRYLRVWKKVGDKCQIIAGCCTPLQ